MSTPKAYAEEVRGHYEDLPYPYRDPQKEGEELYAIDGISLDAFSHVGWAGKRDLRDGARILIAGCGTGDMTVFLAEQLYGCSSEIVAIDLSSASIAIAKARLAKRGLADRVTFHHMSILDVSPQVLGMFDIIESSGVLHHLPDPDAGLAALAPLLKDDGLISIMVYGQHGRQAIYLVQALMKRLMDEGTPRARKIEIAREFLNFVPKGHWLTMNNERFIGDMMWPDGSGIYDLFLHAVDRGYTVPEIYAWLEGARLQLTAFYSEFTDDSLYTPECYAPSPLLRTITAEKATPQRHAIAELMNGNMYKHYFYAAKQAKEPAQLAEDMIITYGPLQALFAGFSEQLLGLLATTPVGQQATIAPRPFGHAPSLQVTKLRHTMGLLRLINGTRTIGEMVAALVQEPGTDAAVVAADLGQLYRELRTRQLVYLRHRSVAPYRSVPQIVERLNAYQARTAG
ncbi:MAG: methyltransferase [Pseudomonadota bacterium]